MKQPKRKRIRLPSGLAGSYDEADGKDPRFDPSPAVEAGLGRGGDRRKLSQLCSQVLRTLQLAWPAGNELAETELAETEQVGNGWPAGGDVLGWTSPAEVVPAPNSHNLLVMIHCNQPIHLVSDQAVLDAIHSRSDELRGEVARAITRKRAPRLSFALIPRIDASHP